MPPLLLLDGPRGTVRERHRSGDDFHPGHRAPDGAGSDPVSHARGASQSRARRQDLAALVTRVEANARARLRDLRSALAEQRDLREVFLALFPEGLTFTPARTPDGERKIWKITLSGGIWFRLRCDPDGIRTRVTGVKGRCP